MPEKNNSGDKNTRKRKKDPARVVRLVLLGVNIMNEVKKLTPKAKEGTNHDSH